MKPRVRVVGPVNSYEWAPTFVPNSLEKMQTHT